MKIALVIGIDVYPYHPLKCAVNDARAMAELLEHNGDGKSTENFQVKIALNIKSIKTLRKLIKDFFAQKSEVSLLFFAGHGQIDSLGGSILAPDCEEDDEGITFRELLELANLSPAANKVVLLDCCHAGAIGMQNQAGTVTPIRDGMTVMTACREYQEAREKGGHGLFTSLVLAALKGGAADVMGEISPGGIYSFIDRSMSHIGQRPVFKTNISRFVSLRTVEPQVPLHVIRKVPEYFQFPQEKFKLDPTFEDTNVGIAIPSNVTIFKHLQQLQSIGLVMPVDADYMYFAAQNATGCMLTPLGQHYWQLASEKSF